VNEVPLGPQVLLNEVERGHPIPQRGKARSGYAKHCSEVGSRCALRGQDVRAPTAGKGS